MAYQFESQNMDASSFKQSGEFAYMLAAKASNDKVTQARIELDVKAMMKEIDNNWSNGAILINKYGESCKEIIENPEGRLEYWLSKP
jgi:hypothetical protein